MNKLESYRAALIEEGAENYFRVEQHPTHGIILRGLFPPELELDSGWIITSVYDLRGFLRQALATNQKVDAKC